MTSPHLHVTDGVGGGVGIVPTEGAVIEVPKWLGGEVWFYFHPIGSMAWIGGVTSGRVPGGPGHWIVAIRGG